MNRKDKKGEPFDVLYTVIMAHWMQSVLALVLLIILSPLLFVIGVVILLFDGGRPVIFRQKRVGRDGGVFILLKFRTMYHGADKDLTKYEELNEADGPVFKIRNDPRFTRVGEFFAHTGLDELPQLVNVLRGEMNIIGPRPLPVKQAEQLEDWQRDRNQVLPGIISPWLFNGYHDSPFSRWMELDLEYIENKSLFYDLKLFFRGIRLAGGMIKRKIKDVILNHEVGQG